jgi:hypothetical protein
MNRIKAKVDAIEGRTYAVINVTNKYNSSTPTSDMFLPVNVAGAIISTINSGGDFTPVWEGGRP